MNSSAFVLGWGLFLLLNSVFRNADISFATCDNPDRKQKVTAANRHRLAAFIHSDEIDTIELKTQYAAFLKTTPINTDRIDTPYLIERTSMENEKGAVEVSAAIELPFPKAVAFDAFADLRRQATYSPWLKSVEYLEGANNDMGSKTRWKLSYLGLKFTWDSICTVQDRNNGILEWKSIAGLKNHGRATFQEKSDGSTYMIMTLTIVVPRFAAQLVGPKNLSSMLEKFILESTVQNFRQIVGEKYQESLRIQRQKQYQRQQSLSVLVVNTNASKSSTRKYLDFLSRY